MTIRGSARLPACYGSWATVNSGSHAPDAAPRRSGAAGYRTGRWYAMR